MSRRDKSVLGAASVPVLYLTSYLSAAQTAGPPEDLSSAYGSAEVISLATGYERPLFDAPVSATIITRTDIERIGAQTLGDLLQTVGGYYVGTDEDRTHHITVRGVTSRALFLVNGIPLQQGYLNATESVYNVLLHDVERIEVTRGPGSAVYGADAVSGIVNVVTRTATDSMPTEFGMTGGTQDTAGAWLLHGARLGELSVRFYGAFLKTDFMNESLRADSQTRLDTVFGTQASFAPGPVNTDRKIFDTRIEVAGDAWTLRASHRSDYDFGTGAGLAFSLDPVGHYDAQLTTVELGRHQALNNVWSVSGYLAYMDVEHSASVILYPPGAFGGAFPSGMCQDYRGEESRVRGEASASYVGVAGHKLLFGAGGLNASYVTSNDTRNYSIVNGVPHPTPTLAPGGGIGLPKLIGDASRNVYYLFAHDEWSPLHDWTVTGGVRWDHYSDFGGTVNPRAAIVWSPSAATNVKLLYGRAFRPPSVVELESNGTYAPLGNSRLRPSTIEMAEIGVNHREAEYEASAGIFRYVQNDLVDTTRSIVAPTGAQYVNGRPDRGWGAEMYLQYHLAGGWEMNANYTFQKHDPRPNNVNAYQSPRHQVYLQLTFAPRSDWSASIGSIGVFDRRRDPSDVRRPPHDYALVNLSANRKHLPYGLQLSLAATNVFDKKYRYPSDSASLLPADLPAPGRKFVAQLVRQF